MTRILDGAAVATDIRSTLTDLSGDPRVHGIILQTPLPDHVVPETVTDAIAIDKDIDGANPLSSDQRVSWSVASPAIPASSTPGTCTRERC